MGKIVQGRKKKKPLIICQRLEVSSCMPLIESVMFLLSGNIDKRTG